jgi:hypothetical protein
MKLQGLLHQNGSEPTTKLEADLAQVPLMFETE